LSLGVVEDDAESGLYATAIRYYNPEWGRFINADTLLGKTGALLSQNVFVYCLNNPVNMIDSTGLEPAPAAVLGIPFREADDLGAKYGPDREVDTLARIRLPNGMVIEGHIGQTPTAYHFDFYPDDKDAFRKAGIALGTPYMGIHYKGSRYEKDTPYVKYDPGIPIIFEVNYPEDKRGGKMTTWAMVHNNDDENEVCV
jgi:RHS repeat-associated protein